MPKENCGVSKMDNKKIMEACDRLDRADQRIAELEAEKAKLIEGQKAKIEAGS